MNPSKLIEILATAAKLKNVMRHSFTAGGRQESVAEHCWRLCFMAYFVKDEFPEADMDKVIRMCIVHDMGEAFTGDVPAFEKSELHESQEEEALSAWVCSLPEPYKTELSQLFNEMSELETIEAKIYKALDNMEAVIQHNEADISSWLPLEYDLQLTYGYDKVQFSEYMLKLREAIADDTRKKIADSTD